MKGQNVSIVGGDTLLGRELRDQLAEQGIRAELKLVGSETEVAGVIGASDSDEAIVLTALDADTLKDSRVLFLTGNPMSSLRVMELIDQTGTRPMLVDLTAGLEDHPEARLRAPSMNDDDGGNLPAGAIHVIAHPAAIMIASLLTRIHKAYPYKRAVILVMEPASERGQAGLTELQQQTRNLFAFQQLNKEVFDAQLSFNLLPRYGSDAPQSLEFVEHRMERHVATLLSARNVTPLPSLRLVQAPVFHGYSMSLWVQFDRSPGPEAVAEALAAAQIEVRAADLEPPSNVGAVGQSGVTAGLIERDRNDANAVWIWAVADNFRVIVDNAIEAARPVLGSLRS